jgi:hypothetical protein
MLSEGLATWAGGQTLTEGYLTPQQVCQAVYGAGALPAIPAIERDWQQFQGHIRHRFNYFAAGCFIGWLVEQYGLEAVRDLYTTSAYPRVTGQSLAGLSADWTATLEANGTDEELVPYTQELSAAYDTVLPLYDGLPTLHRAYIALDEARRALWQADYATVRQQLDVVYNITGYQE